MMFQIEELGIQVYKTRRQSVITPSSSAFFLIQTLQRLVFRLDPYRKNRKSYRCILSC
jgi:hypothetical protein